MIYLALFQPDLNTQIIGLKIAQFLRGCGNGCDLTVFNKYKKIFQYVYNSDKRLRNSSDRVWIPGNAEVAKGKILFCTKYGQKEEWEIADMFDEEIWA